jgi:hypothetical protein
LTLQVDVRHIASEAWNTASSPRLVSLSRLLPALDDDISL